MEKTMQSIQAKNDGKNTVEFTELEAKILTMISIVNHSCGIYTNAEMQGDNNIWLEFRFKTETALNIFIHKLQMRDSDAKAFKDVDNKSLKILI